MYDFQVREDVAHIKEVVAKNASRDRGWGA
jgi:hypothetical protein